MMLCVQDVEDCLELLQPDNFNLIVSSQSFVLDERCVNEEPWFRTRFFAEGLPLFVDMLYYHVHMVGQKQCHCISKFRIASCFEII